LRKCVWNERKKNREGEEERWKRVGRYDEEERRKGDFDISFQLHWVSYKNWKENQY